MRETDNNVMQYSVSWGWANIIYWSFQGKKKKEEWAQVV